MTADPVRARAPSTRWYRVAWALVGLGVVAAAGWWPYATTRVYDAVEAFARTGPQGGAVDLASPGPHTLWVEGPCLSCHDNNPHEYRAAATVSVVDAAGTRLELRAAPPRVFNTARREGRALWNFDAVRAGPHRIALDFDTSGDWDNTPPADIAVSRGNDLPVRIVRPMFLFAGGGIGGGVALAVLTWQRRRRYYAT
jgi:hypothetical protein